LGGHHLVLGEAVDYLTGETREDTLDERYRQKIARLLVEDKGFHREDLTPRVPIDIHVGGKQARVRLDLIVRLDGRIMLLVKYAPGSLTTRHQVALAASRLLAPYQIPFSVVTNGEDADILNNVTGEGLAKGLDRIFSRKELATHLQSCEARPVSQHHREMAARILYAYEVDGRCPCDDSVCEYEHR
jgi:Type I restriction enzyme R protein N terminus (HSDR_N)